MLQEVRDMNGRRCRRKQGTPSRRLTRVPVAVYVQGRSENDAQSKRKGGKVALFRRVRRVPATSGAVHCLSVVLIPAGRPVRTGARDHGAHPGPRRPRGTRRRPGTTSATRGVPFSSFRSYFTVGSSPADTHFRFRPCDR